MNPYSLEELNLFADAIHKVLPQGAVFFLVVAEHDKCGAVCTCDPAKANELRAILAELSQREPQFNN
jgi:hypothetical protein